MFSPEVLKLGAVGTCVARERHEVQGPIEGTVVVGCDIRDEVGGLSGSDSPGSDQEITHNPRVY